MPAAAPTRILIVRIGAMGDILHALPAVAALRAHLPAAHIGWCIEPHWQPLLSSSLVDKIHLVPTRAWKQRPLSLATAREILALRRDLRAHHYDLAADLQGSLRSAVIARLASTPRILGPAHPREAPAAHLYRERIPAIAPDVIAQAAELLSAAIHQPLQPAPALLPADPAAERWCDLQALPPGFVLLVPSAGWGAKQWPHFPALARALTQAGCSVLANATPAGSTALQQAGARPIPSTLPQLIALTRRAALVIGGDTGPLHLAAALGRPVLALFGPTDPARNGPHFPGVRGIVLRNPASRTTYRRTSASEPGLAGITVEEVLSAAAGLLPPP